MRKELSSFLNIGEKSYYVWKTHSHKKLIKFLEQYFTKDEINEYMDTGKVSKLEQISFVEKHIVYITKKLLRQHLFDALFFINILSVLDREFRSLLYIVEKLAEGKNSLQGNKLVREIIKVYENNTDVKELLEKLYINKDNISQINEILYSEDALSGFINKRILDNKYIEVFYENHVSAQNILNLQNTFFTFKEENLLDLTIHSLFDIHSNILKNINETYQPKKKKEYNTWQMASEILRDELINEQGSDDMGETYMEEEAIEKRIDEHWTNEYLKEHINEENPSLDFEQIKKFLYPFKYSIQDNIADQINVHLMQE